uniref:Uncharacterized protein n=1 Tax=Anabaena variabilis TaxID=264691 RepID=Q9ALR7_ANAVA|nr:hypothetical protein [Trichormus variabilis ATCC 29413]
MEAKTPSVCKIDFINNIIAIELLNIVSNWYDGLRDSPESSTLEKILKKRGRIFSEIIRYASPIVVLMIVCQYSNYLLPILGIGEEISIENLQACFIFFGSIFYGRGYFFGFKLEAFID